MFLLSCPVRFSGPCRRDSSGGSGGAAVHAHSWLWREFCCKTQHRPAALRRASGKNAESGGCIMLASEVAPSALLANERYGRLLPLCYSGLKKTINPASSLYDRQLRDARLANTLGTEDLTSTCICLIGVDRSHSDPGSISFERRRTLQAVVKLAAHRQYLGATGLLVWANSVGGELHLRSSFGRLECHRTTCRTM